MFKAQSTSFDEAEVWGLNDPHLKDFPKRGIGRRAMFCKRYDNCLYKAAVKDWETFNCEGCRYEECGQVDFSPSEFVIFDADEVGHVEAVPDSFEMDCYRTFSAWMQEVDHGSQ